MIDRNQFLGAFINRHLDWNNKAVWDEWSFYEEFHLLDQAAKFLKEAIEEQLDINDIDFIVGLSKSGLPLAAVMAKLYNKPLLPFAIGEFFSPNGDTVIGFPDSYELKIKNKNILVFDSHIKSGETYRLFQKIITPDLITISHFGVIADCRTEENDIALKNFSSVLSKDKVSSFIENLPKRHTDTFFWKHSRQHWLVPPHNNRSSSGSKAKLSPKNRIRKIDEDLSKRAIAELVSARDGDESFYPLTAYWYIKLCLDTTKKIFSIFQKKQIDTVVACSVIAIPLTILICSFLNTVNSNVKFIFLGNGNENYFKDKFAGSKKILFCDDVLATGALMYKAYQKFVGQDKSLEGIVVLLHQQNFPFKDYVAELPASVDIFTLI